MGSKKKKKSQEQNAPQATSPSYESQEAKSVDQNEEGPSVREEDEEQLGDEQAY